MMGLTWLAGTPKGFQSFCHDKVQIQSPRQLLVSFLCIYIYDMCSEGGREREREREMHMYICMRSMHIHVYMWCFFFSLSLSLFRNWGICSYIRTLRLEVPIAPKIFPKLLLCQSLGFRALGMVAGLHMPPRLGIRGSLKNHSFKVSPE